MSYDETQRTAVAAKTDALVPRQTNSLRLNAEMTI